VLYAIRSKPSDTRKEVRGFTLTELLVTISLPIYKLSRAQVPRPPDRGHHTKSGINESFVDALAGVRRPAEPTSHRRIFMHAPRYGGEAMSLGRRHRPRFGRFNLVVSKILHTDFLEDLF